MQQAQPYAVPTLPDRMSILFVTSPGCTSHWLSETLANDSAVHIQSEEAADMAEALSRLRESMFDIVLIRHLPPTLDAVEVLDAIRTGSSSLQPMIVLGDMPENELTDACFEAGADAYVCINSATTRSLIWHVARASERHRLQLENLRLRRLEARYRENEQNEALETLSIQQEIACDSDDEPPEPSELLICELRETLRTYVIMGSGNLRAEVQQLAVLALKLGCSSRSVLLAMNNAIEEVLRGLGNRSARHVMNRANLLTIELMTRLSDVSSRAAITANAALANSPGQPL